MKVEIKLDYAKIRQIEKAAKDSAREALEVVCTDIQNVVPLDSGGLLNSIYVDSADMDDGFHAWIDHGMIYARYLYYGLLMVDPTTGRAWAGKDVKKIIAVPNVKLKFKNGRKDHWLEPYITGDKKDFVQVEFVNALRRRVGI